ncbi:MAG: hypothetical protein HWN67_19190, partial [Candidatus Helarchaeota archaeon]|nr:hypothetical protein [Candidatus Helarchaeota archaeon]
MGLNKKNISILMISTLIIVLSIYSLNSSLFNNNLSLFPFAQTPNKTEDITTIIASGEKFEHFKDFEVWENTGSNQTDVIIDPVIFTEERRYCYKDSIRVYKSPYSPGDEIVSQVYNLEPNAWETFSSSPDFGNPTGWTTIEPADTYIQVLPRFGGHKKVVELYDNTSSDFCSIQYGFGAQTSGTYYLTAMTTKENMTAALDVSGVAGIAASIGYRDNGQFFYVNGASYPDSGIIYEVNKWYTFKVTFDCGPDTYSAWYWDETSQNWSVITLNSNFRLAQVNVQNYYFHSGGIIANNGSFYVAAVDSSWETGYQEDQILYLSSANIAFIDNLTANETKKYRVYYNSTPTAPANYNNIQRNGYTVNFTSGESAIMYVGNVDGLRQFDKNGNEHLAGATGYGCTTTVEVSGGGSVQNSPIISDGSIFIETWHIDSENEWSMFRCYANSYIYKFHNFSGSGSFDWRVFSADGVGETIDFEGIYYHQSNSWQYEAFDYTGGSWENHWETIDQGKMFQEDNGDSNILITLWDISQDSDANDILFSECNFGNPANARVAIGNVGTPPYAALTSSFGGWQFYLDAGSTNVNDKQDFIDNLYDVLIGKPPTIGVPSFRDPIYYYKEFNVTENSGSNQTNVIIDPVFFTEENKYCFKDSIRLYKSPYGSTDELVSQVYNLTPNAWETFSNSPDFEDPSGWTVSAPLETNITVLPRFGGYKKVVEMFDNSSSGNFCSISDSFSNQISGTSYISIMTTTSNSHNAIALTGSGGYATTIGFYPNGSIYYAEGPVATDSGVKYETNKWYTFKVTFDCTTDKYSAWYWNETNLNWCVLCLNSDFTVTQVSIDSHLIHTSGTSKGTFYIAAIDNSWDPGYEEDRILYVSSANIAFIDDLEASETKSYRIYYSNSPIAPAGYANILRTGYTVNFTDGSSAIMYIMNVDILRQFDKMGNEHLSGSTNYAQTATQELGGGEFVITPPIISDGPIFIETWHVDSSDEWSMYRYYSNSYIYKYHNYSGSGGTVYFVFSRSNINVYFNGLYHHQSGAWQYEAYDWGGGWQDHPNAVDAGKLFQEDAGDPNILITIWNTTQDPYLDDILVREADFPNPASVSMSIGRHPVTLNYEIVNSFGIWQFYQDVESTNVTNKQNFVDNLYEVLIGNPPTIGSLGPRYEFEKPNIIEVLQDPTIPGNLDSVNITVHITDDAEVDTVWINTNYSGSPLEYQMEWLSGSNQDGYWNYTIPQGTIGTTINYSIWVNDTSGNTNITTIYKYLIRDSEFPNIIGVSQDPPSPGNLDTVNITVHITDNFGVHTVL